MANKKKRAVRKSVKPVKTGKVKRGGAKKTAKAVKAVKAKSAKTPGIKLNKIGEVTHYFPHVKAAAVKLKSALAVGDDIYIKGHTTDFKETVRSIQLDHVAMDKGKKAQEIGLFVKSRVRIGDSVYKV